MKKAFRVSFFAATCALVLTACAGGEPPPSSFPGLTLDDQHAYLASNTHVYKFDAGTGAEAWRFPPAQQQGGDGAPVPGPFAGSPLKFGNLIIAGGTIGVNGKPDPTLYALSENSGEVAWRFTGGAAEYTDGVATDGKLIFAPNGDNNLYALDPTIMSGAEPSVTWVFTGSADKLWTRPLVADGKVYQPSLDHNLYALDAATGKELWRFSADASMASTPAIKDGVLYAGSFDRKFYAIDAESGKQLWETDGLTNGLLEGWVWNDATVDGDVIYVGDVKGKFYAIDARTGKILWSSQLNGAIHGQPVIQGDRVYVVSFDTYVYALNRTPTPDGNGVVAAERLGEIGLGRRLTSTPAIYADALLVPLFDGEIRLTALDLETGAKKYEFPPKPAQ